jgi:hypothetical protein
VAVAVAPPGTAARRGSLGANGAAQDDGERRGTGPAPHGIEAHPP